MFFVRMWGTRGSIACPGEDNTEFGGNTACIEIRAGDTVSCVDFGTGVRPFGEYLAAHDIPAGLTAVNCFITHTHWDHIIGFPMFAPVFFPQMKFDVYAPHLINGKSLKDVIENALEYEYWPVNLSDMNADITFHPLRETTLHLAGGLEVTSKYLNHPVINLGYRFRYEGKTIAVIHDTEPFFNQFEGIERDGRAAPFDRDASRESARAAAEENGKLIAFIRGADIAVYDAQYTEEQYQKEKKNWGHSSHECAIRNAIEAGVKTVVLHHHDPGNKDKRLREIESQLKAEFSPHTDVIMAREGMKLEL